MRFHELESTLLAISSVEREERFRHEMVLALRMLRSCVRFYAGDIDCLPGQDFMRYVDFPKSPFPQVGIEMEFNRAGISYDVICFISDLKDQEDLGGVVLFVRYKSDPLRQWRPVGRAVVDRLSGEWEFAPTRYIDRIEMDQQNDARKMAGQIFQLCIATVSRFLDVLNCVNVRTEDVPAPTALNKKRAKAGKPPIYSYKTLVLRPNAATRADGGGTHESPRIHLRRGHIKRRKTGNFWWQPCVVGDRKKGVVMKDYRADKLVESAACSTT